MTYWLEKRIVQREGKSPRILWKRYAACGSPELLERVRMGQKHPELSRVSECRRMKSDRLICTAAAVASIWDWKSAYFLPDTVS